MSLIFKIWGNPFLCRMKECKMPISAVNSLVMCWYLMKIGCLACCDKASGFTGVQSCQDCKNKSWCSPEERSLSNARSKWTCFLSIPLFTQGSHQACCSIRELDMFVRAREIKVDPDKPLEGVRLAALQVTALLHLWGGEWDRGARWPNTAISLVGALPVLSPMRVFMEGCFAFFWRMAKVQVEFREINIFLQSNSSFPVIVNMTVYMFTFISFPETCKVALPLIALCLSQHECVTDLAQTCVCSPAYTYNSCVTRALHQQSCLAICFSNKTLPGILPYLTAFIYKHYTISSVN